MKNSIKNTLIGMLGASALTLGSLGLNGCYSPKNNTYSRIESKLDNTQAGNELKELYQNIDLTLFQRF